MELYLKFRFYYQEFTNTSSDSSSDSSSVSASASSSAKSLTSAPSAPSHLNLHRFYFTTEAYAGEYDIIKCNPNTSPPDCISEITARWKVSDMLDCDPVKNPGQCQIGDKGAQLIYAGGHCHAPSCLSLELYNLDTGNLICRQAPTYGKGSILPFDEKDYILISPCVWGNEPGLTLPNTIYLNTSLLSVKRNNNTYGHYGEMASWQMRGVFL